MHFSELPATSVKEGTGDLGVGGLLPRPDVLPVVCGGRGGLAHHRLLLPMQRQPLPDAPINEAAQSQPCNMGKKDDRQKWVLRVTKGRVWETRLAPTR